LVYRVILYLNSKYNNNNNRLLEYQIK
jgi:hypothetical protein